MASRHTNDETRHVRGSEGLDDGTQRDHRDRRHHRGGVDGTVRRARDVEHEVRRQGLRRRPEDGPRGCDPGRGRRTPSGDRRVAREGAQDRRLPRLAVHRRVQPRPHPRPAARRRRRPRQVQGRVVGPPGRGRRPRLRAPLRGLPGQEVHGLRAQGGPQGGRRALPRDGRRPRGRGHRLAPPRDAQAEGPGPPDGVPRDHRVGHPGRRREPARPRPGPRRRAGDPPHPRPALRLRGQPRAVEEGHAEALGGPRAVGGHPRHRRARARADGVRVRRLLGHRRPAAGDREEGRAGPAQLQGRADVDRRRPRRHRPRLRLARAAQEQRRQADSTRATPAGSRRRSPTGTTRSRRSRRSPTRASPTRRS